MVLETVKNVNQRLKEKFKQIEFKINNINKEHRLFIEFTWLQNTLLNIVFLRECARRKSWIFILLFPGLEIYFSHLSPPSIGTEILLTKNNILLI